MHIAVIGSGYVGLVTGACFAEFGFNVTCVDVNEETINTLNKGKSPIYEPGLDQLVLKNKDAKRLTFTTDTRAAVEQANVIFLAVGTPPLNGGSPNLSFIEQAARDIARYMNGYKVIVTKSTVPVGTGQRLRQLIRDNQTKPCEFDIVSNPEFLREGVAIDDFRKPDRIVIGRSNEKADAVMLDLYRPLDLTETSIVFTSIEAAELIKYVSNAFLATKISFINEVANLCDEIGCDVQDVARGMGMDERIGRHFLHPGPGYGGSCFPKDTSALVEIAREHNSEALIVRAVIEVNLRQRERMISKIEKLVGELKGKTVAVLGLAFKPETDDMREAPSVDIIKALIARGAHVRAFDPEAMGQAKKVLPDAVDYAGDEYAAVEGADALVIVTEWNQFRALDMRRVKASMRTPKVADLRNIYEPADMDELGFDYVGVGRSKEVANKRAAGD